MSYEYEGGINNKARNLADDGDGIDSTVHSVSW